MALPQTDPRTAEARTKTRLEMISALCTTMIVNAETMEEWVENMGGASEEDFRLVFAEIDKIMTGASRLRELAPRISFE